MIKEPSKFYKHLIENFPFQPTEAQNKLFLRLSNFIFDAGSNELFVLKGYAGTGKTAVISHVVKHLWQVQRKAVLLAPTGRAAKVITSYAKHDAQTIHKKIYHPKKQSNGSVSFVKQPNKHQHTLFFVDEASMIPDDAQNENLFDKQSLLADLIDYVNSGLNCHLVFIGDTAQLPPVKSLNSPALDRDHLQFHYNKEVVQIELDQVMRQADQSGILTNATQIRYIQENDFFEGLKIDTNFPDIVRLNDGYEIEEALNSAYDREGFDESLVIVRSNKRANLYNQQIRQKIRGFDESIAVGDHLMAVKNNYFWTKDNSQLSFIANGDTFEILKIYTYKNLYGFSFVEVQIKMLDYENARPLDTVLLLDTLSAEAPALTYEQNNQLYHEVSKDYNNLSSKYKRLLAIKNNRFFNAIQVKYAYAITCHKSQGGQWKQVFIEQPYLPNGPDMDYYRWLYTAFTRAQEKLMLIGFKDSFFE